MSASRYPEIVMMARRGKLEQASELLTRHGIPSRNSRPRRNEGVLRVADVDAEKARRLLQAAFGPMGIVSASEAAWFRCRTCRAPLSFGAKACAVCHAPVGDFQGG